MPELADTTLALEFLLMTKTAVRNTAIALTETATPALRKLLKKQLDLAIDLHEETSNFMISKGWLHPYEVTDQFKLDKKSVEAALMIGAMKLYADDTSKRGMMADLGE
ncbi:spore coat protein [Bacillus lacus]|uniref:Spore coat protein n=2 Tax=Metabacillus lacus TaxID=1983721 RepID=A0A7X2IZ91_9BACI|nr:spore coat protein [Metabacillus lacus]